jgi:hypothetical protein
MPDAKSNTVCIAAVCVPDKTGRVFAILCSDSKIEIEGLASGTIGFKGISIAPGITIMYAGSVPKSKEMIDRYRFHLNNPRVALTHKNALDILSVPLQAQQIADATSYLSATQGIKYKDYLAKSPADQQALLYGMPAWKAYCDLIVVWLGDGFVRLFYVSETISEQSSFATVGSGASAASASLFARGYQTYCDLRQAAYYVYEAKRNSENVPGVGKETFMEICEFDTAARTHVRYPLNTREIEVLGMQFLKLGPQPFEILGGDAQLSLDFIPGKKP